MAKSDHFSFFGKLISVGETVVRLFIELVDFSRATDLIGLQKLLFSSSVLKYRAFMAM